jgi:Na+-translocating ferredoxin:NAD+ oxidoreductase RnfC subunit
VAILDAVVHWQPLISRASPPPAVYLGKRCERVEVLVGTPWARPLAFAGLDQSVVNCLIAGGPIYGFTRLTSLCC